MYVQHIECTVLRFMQYGYKYYRIVNSGRPDRLHTYTYSEAHRQELTSYTIRLASYAHMHKHMHIYTNKYSEANGHILYTNIYSDANIRIYSYTYIIYIQIDLSTHIQLISLNKGSRLKEC